MNFWANCELSRLNSIPFLLEPCYDLPKNFFNHCEYGITSSLFNLGIETLYQVIQQHVAFDMTTKSMSRPRCLWYFTEVGMCTFVHCQYILHVMVKGVNIDCPCRTPQLILHCFLRVTSQFHIGMYMPYTKSMLRMWQDNINCNSKSLSTYIRK
jgi:hypothetical protein